LAAWNAASGGRHATLGQAIDEGADAAERVRDVLERRPVEQGSDGFDRSTLVERFQQFYDETFVIIPRVCDALAGGRLDEVGDLVDRSQRGAERGLRNQVPETVFLADSARQLGATAASAFGAGFGGSVWALVREASIDDFCREWASRFRTTFPQCGRHAQFFRTHAGPPTTRLV
jgi:galactokinase